MVKRKKMPTIPTMLLFIYVQVESNTNFEGTIPFSLTEHAVCFSKTYAYTLAADQVSAPYQPQIMVKRALTTYKQKQTS